MASEEVKDLIEQLSEYPVTIAFALNRKQAEDIANDLLNSLDVPQVETVLVISSSDPAVVEFFHNVKAGYQSVSEPAIVSPQPDMLYVGDIFTLAMAPSPEELLKNNDA